MFVSGFDLRFAQPHKEIAIEKAHFGHWSLRTPNSQTKINAFSITITIQTGLHGPQEVYSIIDDGNNGELDVEEMCEYLISAFDRDLPKLAQALKQPHGVIVKVAKRSSQDVWAGTDEIPPDNPIPKQIACIPARRPG